MDVTNFLKTVPAVIGLAGLLTYFMREQKPDSKVELVNIVRNVQTGFVLLGCTALILLSLWLFFRSEPPGHDAAGDIRSRWLAPIAYGNLAMIRLRLRQPVGKWHVNQGLLRLEDGFPIDCGRGQDPFPAT
jgi:hypothetical protein